ncbi:MAG: prepilin-type N-terminal cleavage/methylation domain-containing protein [Candidatus Kerfeldbacteria bacterium]|nr:prepilin-type N-terminal cleavage/methylation domain-containing protein [Candidatus Kerfeldbacteria bacterium]
MPFFSKPAGLTLVELLISIAVIGILSSIVFVGFYQDRERSAVKRAAEQLQVDVQSAQNRAQSGVLTGGSLPAGYGVHFDVATPDRYLIFADALSGSPPAGDNEYRPPPGGTDTIVTTVILPSRVVVHRIGVISLTFDRGSAVFSVPNAQSTLRVWDAGGAASTPSSLPITLRQTRANLCYSVTIVPSGTVSQRQLDSCS